MDSSAENVENYTKKVSKMCKITHFPHFNKNKGICRIDIQGKFVFYSAGTIEIL